MFSHSRPFIFILKYFLFFVRRQGFQYTRKKKSIRKMKNSLTDIGSRKREDTLKQRDDKLEDPPSQSRNAPRGVKYKVGNETYIRSIRIYEELGAALDGIAPSGQCVGRALRSSHLWPGHRVERESCEGSADNRSPRRTITSARNEPR